MPNSYNITEELSNMRFDQALVFLFPEISRSKMQKYIKEGIFLLNGKKETPHTLTQIGDIITGEIPKKKILQKEIPTLQIIEETDDYLVINKQAGFSVHPPHEHYELPSIVDAILKHASSIQSVGEDSLRPGIIHRLDKDVSGVMVIAKNQKSFEDLKQQFQNRTVKKIYTALVYGEMTNEKGIIDFPMEKKGTKMVVIPKGNEGKEAITEYEVKKSFQDYTLVEVQIKTGRMHQIRAHLSFLGYPVVGENLYLPRKFHRQKKFDRLFLHSSTLSFTNVHGEDMIYHCPLPEELANFLQTLK